MTGSIRMRTSRFDPPQYSAVIGVLKEFRSSTRRPSKTLPCSSIKTECETARLERSEEHTSELHARASDLSTAILSRDWSPEGIQKLYQKTIEDLTLLLNKNGVRNGTVRRLFVDLYTDYIYAGLDAMK